MAGRRKVYWSYARSKNFTIGFTRDLDETAPEENGQSVVTARVDHVLEFSTLLTGDILNIFSPYGSLRKGLDIAEVYTYRYA